MKLQDDTTVSTTFNGTTTTVTDQAGKQRRQLADALGRVIRVDEPDASGSLTTPIPTSYEYDGNDNLSKVIQSDGTVTQERLFKYDSLSRLTSERQVEANATLNDAGTYVGAGGQWTKVLKYDSHGLLTEGFDARGVRTQFTYDGLNRVKTVSFSDGTPSVTYTYDQARSGYFNTGALTRVETAVGDANLRPDTPDTASEFDYDNMGRVVNHRNSIGTQIYPLEYGYNLAGQLTSEKYPSGKVVTMGYDSSGRLASIADQSRTFANNFQYQTNGGMLSAFNLGNGTTQSFGFNDRLQMTQQNLTKGSDVIQKYDYGYGQIDQNGNLDLTKNNGQLGQVTSHIGTAKQWTQKFSYDSVGRLSESSEYRGDNSQLSYKQKFDFDSFGNLYRKQASNPIAGQLTPLPYTPIEDTDISKSNNRFTTNTTYDDAGNVIQDAKFRNLNYSYDANGRMFKTSNATSQSNSVYDSAGQRVATQVDGVWTFFVYDAFGKMVAEYGGVPAIDEGGIKYVLQDWQGSSRAILSQTGNVQARMDYTAFGEEINSGVGQRTTTQGFNAKNDLSQKYAQTERDKATGLDHTWFRKNENKAGRWTSPDPYNGSMSLGNPQSFNRYSYVENEPIDFVDPSGLFTIGPGANRTMSWFEFCHLFGFCGNPNANSGGETEPGGGSGGGNTPAQTGNCGVNPVTGKPGINPKASGVEGEIRPGVGGGGFFDSRRPANKSKIHGAADISFGTNSAETLIPQGPQKGQVEFIHRGSITPILSGTVASIGYNKGLGYYVEISHGAGYTSVYAHLAFSMSGSLTVGQSVKPGDAIGYGGQTGNAQGQSQSEAHLHSIVRKNGIPIDPVGFLNSPCPPGL